MSHEYRNSLDKKNNAKINAMLDELPVFVEDFYNHLVDHIESYMSRSEDGIELSDPQVSALLACIQSQEGAGALFEPSGGF